MAATAGTAAAIEGSIAGGAIAGAAGSIVSQGVGVATGIQDSFSWKAVALSAIAGGVSAGMGPGGVFGKAGAFSGLGNSFAAAGLRSAASSMAAQGIAVITGLQDKFDWAGVAAAGVSGGINSLVARGFPVNPTTGFQADFQNFGASMAGAVANAASRSLVSGGDFGDNMMAALPDVLGQTVGGLIADGISRPRGGAPADSGGTLAAPGATAQTIDSDALAWMNGGAPISAEQAAAAAAAIQGAFPQGSSGADFGGFGVHGDVFGSDTLTAWLGSEFLKEGRAADFDDYVGKWGSAAAVGGLLYSEANGVAAGQLNNQFIMLGYLSGQGSQTAAGVARSLYSQTPGAAIQMGLGLSSSSLTRSYDLGTLLSVSYAVSAPRQDVSNGYVLTSAPAPLNGWQRAGAAINGVGHGIVAGLLGLGAFGTAPAIATGPGALIPVGLGIGAGIEGDRSYTDFKTAWTGRASPTLGAQAISNFFSISPSNAELAYTGVQLATGAAGAGSGGSIMLEARANQIAGNYAPDVWGLTFVRNGDLMAGGLPGRSPYYMDVPTLNAANGSRTALWDSVQVNPWRSQVAVYRAEGSFFAASGYARANTGLGAGGGYQFFVPGYTSRLQPVSVRNLGP